MTRSRNRAVLSVLAAGLLSSSAETRASAIRATILRTDLDSHTQLIRHFGQLDAAAHVVIRDAHHAMPHHTAPALKAAVSEDDATLCTNACRIILLCRAYDLFPVLVKAAENARHRHATGINATIRQLSELLHDEIATWAAGDRTGHDPSFARHHLLTSLERSIKRPAEHHPPELLDAFMLLAPSDNATMIEIMRDSRHPCHAKLTSLLATDKSPAIMERLVELLHDTDAPAGVLEAVARRTDPLFVNFLLHALKYPVPLRVLHNMKRLRSVAWLEADRDFLLELDGRAQVIAVDLALASQIESGSLFELLKLILQNGLAEGRRASCQALARFDHEEANKLALAALNDPDAAVQAAAVRQLRSRRLPRALQLLVARLAAPSTEVRDAARSSLAEFNFVRYRAMFDLLDEKAVRTTGILVRQVDQSARQKLIEELTSPSVTARLRGIEMAVAMEATDDVREQLIALARHENASVRKEAVAALAHASGSTVVGALERATRDANRSVADAAQQSLAKLGGATGTAKSEHPVAGSST